MRAAPPTPRPGPAPAGRRWVLTAAGLAAAAVALGACGPTSHDNPAFSGPAPAGATPVTAAAGQPAAGSVPVTAVAVGTASAPRVGAVTGAAAINAAARSVAAGLAGHGSCPFTTTRADAALLSFRWTCADGTVATASFSAPSGARLALGGVLRGGYLQYLSSVAVAQLEAAGTPPAEAGSAAAPTPQAFSRWGVAPGALTVTFPLRSGPATLTFPLATLAPYLVPGGPLG